MTSPLTYSIEQAAERLGGPFTVDWLRARVKRKEVDFVKTGVGTGRGGRVGFSESQLAAIVEKYSVAAVPQVDKTRPITRRRAS